MEEQPINLLQPQNPPLSQGLPPKKRRFGVYFFIILLLAGLAGTFYLVREHSLAQLPGEAQAYDPVTLKPKKVGFLQSVKNFIFHSNNYLQGQKDNRINILLLGMGGAGHDGPYLTDTNIVISIKPNERTAAMISIPRDLGVKIDNYGYQKINSVNSIGEQKEAGQGGEYARQVFSKQFNTDIPYYVRVDFKAFTEIINTVGGVTVNVPNSFTDTMFPGPNNSYQTITFSAGIQTMDGEKALQYARSRHGNNQEGSDFARSRRQQLVISALKEKLLSINTYTNPLRVQKIFESLSTHISTNLDFGQMMFLASMVKDIDGEVKNLVIDSSRNGFLINTTADNGAFMLSPKNGNFDDINNAIKNVFEMSLPAATMAVATPTVPIINKSAFPSAKIEIQNGTWRVGLASRVQKRLEDGGFKIAVIGNALKRPQTKTAVYIVNPTASTEIINDLTKELKVSASTSLPNWLKEDYDDASTTENEAGVKFRPDTDILVVLGENISE